MSSRDQCSRWSWGSGIHYRPGCDIKFRFREFLSTLGCSGENLSKRADLWSRCMADHRRNRCFHFLIGLHIRMIKWRNSSLYYKSPHQNFDFTQSGKIVYLLWHLDQHAILCGVCLCLSDLQNIVEVACHPRTSSYPWPNSVYSS